MKRLKLKTGHRGFTRTKRRFFSFTRSKDRSYTRHYSTLDRSKAIGYSLLRHKKCIPLPPHPTRMTVLGKNYSQTAFPPVRKPFSASFFNLLQYYGSRTHTTMAESSKTPKAKRRGGRYCIAGTPNQQSCKNTSFTPGIRMHQFPSDPSVRAQWVRFVRRHRHDYKDPTSKYASLCSAHFDESCYERKMSVVSSVKKEYKLEMRVFKIDCRANERFCYPSITRKDKPARKEEGKNFICLHAYFRRSVLQ